MSEMTDTTNATTNASVRYDSQSDVGDELHSLQTYVSDLLALVQHIQVPIERQLNIDDASSYSEALTIINQIKSVMATQSTALTAQLETLGGHAGSPIKSAWSSLLGAGAAAVDSVRKTKVSKSLRDDYTALGLTSISYTMLHATALGIGEANVAALAQQHLAQITPIIISISKAMPAVVLQELRDDGQTVRVSAAELSAQATQKAWQQPS